MTLYSRYLHVLFTLTFCGNLLYAAPSTGENLWPLTAVIGIAVDEFALAKAACCVGTFTALADIRDQESIMQNSIQDLANAQATCCASIADIQANLSGGSPGCTPTALTIATTGTTISTAGVYCLNNDPILTEFSTIAINASNVVLDLGGHTITGSGAFGSAGITINSGFSNITITNGTITSCYDGINMTTISGTRNITLKDLLIVNSSHKSIDVSTSSFVSNLLIQNVSMNSVGQGHISLNGNIGCVVESCIMRGANQQAFITGSFMTVTFLNCIGISGGTNGFAITNSTNVAFDNCKALSCAGNGFAVTVNSAGDNGNITFNNCVSNDSPGGNGFLISVSGRILNTTFNNCQALHNNVAGFATTSDTSGIANSVFQSCVAQKNTSFGFSINATISTASTIFNNCQALNNTSDGFSITCNQGSADAVIQDCIAEKNNSSGFTINATTSTINTTLNNCIAHINNQHGFTMTGDTNATLNTALTNCTATLSTRNGFSFLGSSVTHNCQLQNCTSADNNGIGFNLGNGISSGTNIIKAVLKGCTAENNVINGFDFEGLGTTHSGEIQDCTSSNHSTSSGFLFTTSICNYLVNNCSACKNSGSGFDFTGIADSSCCNIQHCSATCNNAFGFNGSLTESNDGNSAIFYLNQASRNASGNYNALGTQSAGIVLFSTAVPTNTNKAVNLANV